MHPGLPADALPALDGFNGCCDAKGALQPGGALLCLEPSTPDQTPPAAATTDADADADAGVGGGGGGELPSAPPPPLACVACVIGPSGSLSLWLPKEERAGLLELL